MKWYTRIVIDLVENSTKKFNFEKTILKECIELTVNIAERSYERFQEAQTTILTKNTIKDSTPNKKTLSLKAAIQLLVLFECGINAYAGYKNSPLDLDKLIYEILMPSLIIALRADFDIKNIKFSLIFPSFAEEYLETNVKEFITAIQRKNEIKIGQDIKISQAIEVIGKCSNEIIGEVTNEISKTHPSHEAAEIVNKLKNLKNNNKTFRPKENTERQYFNFSKKPIENKNVASSNNEATILLTKFKNFLKNSNHISDIQMLYKSSDDKKFDRILRSKNSGSVDNSWAEFIIAIKQKVIHLLNMKIANKNPTEPNKYNQVELINHHQKNLSYFFFNKDKAALVFEKIVASAEIDLTISEKEFCDELFNLNITNVPHEESLNKEYKKFTADLNAKPKIGENLDEIQTSSSQLALAN